AAASSSASRGSSPAPTRPARSAPMSHPRISSSSRCRTHTWSKQPKTSHRKPSNATWPSISTRSGQINDASCQGHPSPFSNSLLPSPGEREPRSLRPRRPIRASPDGSLNSTKPTRAPSMLHPHPASPAAQHHYRVQYPGSSEGTYATVVDTAVSVQETSGGDP